MNPSLEARQQYFSPSQLQQKDGTTVFLWTYNHVALLHRYVGQTETEKSTSKAHFAHSAVSHNSTQAVIYRCIIALNQEEIIKNVRYSPLSHSASN